MQLHTLETKTALISIISKLIYTITILCHSEGNAQQYNGQYYEIRI